jgi:hypothetical protein
MIEYLKNNWHWVLVGFAVSSALGISLIRDPPRFPPREVSDHDVEVCRSCFDNGVLQGRAQMTNPVCEKAERDAVRLDALLAAQEAKAEECEAKLKDAGQ